MEKLIAMATVLAIALAPLVAAEPEDESIVGAGGVYVADDGLWEETNEAEGLQRQDLLDEETGELILAADTEILTV